MFPLSSVLCRLVYIYIHRAHSDQVWGYVICKSVLCRLVHICIHRAHSDQAWGYSIWQEHVDPTCQYVNTSIRFPLSSVLSRNIYINIHTTRLISFLYAQGQIWGQVLLQKRVHPIREYVSPSQRIELIYIHMSVGRVWSLSTIHRANSGQVWGHVIS